LFSYFKRISEIDEEWFDTDSLYKSTLAIFNLEIWI